MAAAGKSAVIPPRDDRRKPRDFDPEFYKSRPFSSRLHISWSISACRKAIARAEIKQAKSEPFLAQGAELLRSALPEPLQIKATAATDDAQRALADKAMRALSNPAAPSPARPCEEQAPNYKPGDRRDMNRLIENSR